MFDPSKRARPAPDFSGIECQGLSDTDRARLWDAANRLINARGAAVRVTGWLSQGMLSVTGRLEAVGTKMFGSVWDDVQGKIRDAVEAVLWKAHDIATIGVGSEAAHDPRSRLHRLSASASGAMSGFAGLPGLLVDIPVTTTLMLRSMAEIAREHGEDITTEDGKRACLEVLAQGGPRTGPRHLESDEAEVGYWSARAGLSHLTIAALIRTAAARLGVTLSEKLLAQTVPLAGAVAGAGLNWVFMGYYQDMARVHFTIRAVERASGDPTQVRRCFDQLVAQARILKSGSSRGRMAGAKRPAQPGPIIDVSPEPGEHGI